MKPLVRNSIAMGLFNVFGRASGFIRYILLVRFLNDPAFALITYGFSIGRLCRTFMDGGLDHLISRDGSRKREDLPPFLAQGAFIKAGLGVFFFLAAAYYLRGFEGFTSFQLLIVFISLTGSAFTSICGLLRSGFAAIERMEFILLTNVPARFFSIALLAVILVMQGPLVAVAAAIALEGILWLLLLLRAARRRLPRLRWQVSARGLRYMVGESWSLALYSFFTVLYLSLDVLMIQALMSLEDVAAYTIASQLIEGINMLVSSYLLAVFPVLSRSFTEDDAAYQRLFRQSFRLLLIITLPIAGLLAGWPQQWLDLIRDTGPETPAVLRILAANLPLTMINTLLIFTFTTRNRQIWLVGFTTLAVLLSVAANALLIPLYQQSGAAMASLLTQAVLFIIIGASALRLFPLSVDALRALGLVAVTLLALACTQWIEAPVIIPAALFGLCWLALAWLLRLIDRDDVKRLGRALQTKSPPQHRPQA